MLLKGYTKEIFRPECNPSFQSLHCIAHLDQDVSEVLPYLNAVLGGFEYIKDPPAVTFRVHGKITTIHSREIAINALKNEEEADKILECSRGRSTRHGRKETRLNRNMRGCQNRRYWRYSDFSQKLIAGSAENPHAWSLL